MFNLIGADGKQYGPVTADQLRQWAREGRLNAQSQVQPVDGAWAALGTLPEFADLFPRTPSVPPLPPVAGNRAGNKIAAGICGILLGGLGVHKFILGYTNTGLLMLGLSVGGALLGLFTCGATFLATWAIGIIGFVEGIIYLTKTDEEFIRLYVDNRREWF